MISRRNLLSSALAASAAIGLAACSDDDSSSKASDGGGSDSAKPALDAVTISEDLGKAPTVKFTAPLNIEEPDARTIVAGKGDQISEGDTLIWRTLYVDASSGKTKQSWWDGAPAGSITVTSDDIGAKAKDFLTTATVKSRVALAGWQQDSKGSMVSLVQVSDIDRIVSPLRAKGKQEKPSGDLPAVKLGKDGAPSLSGKPEGDPPSKTTVEMLIRGGGRKTKKGDHLVMQYTGWTWDDAKQFDSSWERGTPFGFTQGQGDVIKGWDEHLTDLPVGSQVMLVIPPKDAYGTDEKSGGELAGKTLVFVVDVLDAASPKGS
ncbi:peptidylprolyl isomerase [Brachybacterium endophyticum]|uniref:Peptidyl-prolyl cis-trans isomerase n=1 Tax=Brachybacterium endophyticum TaxID=2182385 RepID=A0A2U2RIG5_9MICO|nr:FKBP-type peptidyl-prolyl cis-trans isomerase [Brachybacterium endophyticum]PWH05677.1 peptidylprolyl isomerase [Brachybacterium endophyticum]